MKLNNNASIVNLANHNTANEWGILKGSLSVVFLILFSYQWLGWGCDLQQNPQNINWSDDDDTRLTDLIARMPGFHLLRLILVKFRSIQEKISVKNRLF